ncbi:hypothetical protein J1614_010334 [Plenodomus biglobosus]|nr:hypothetical protein J1614_010334 [Plenodomus biglobosus]
MISVTLMHVNAASANPGLVTCYPRVYSMAEHETKSTPWSAVLAVVSANIGRPKSYRQVKTHQALSAAPYRSPNYTLQ